MTFEQLELDDSLCQAVADMGFTKPTSIQSLVIPAAMEGRDILASAPTGTGKTAAFLLPACQYLLDFPRQEPGATRILILTPTRELAIQVYEQACQITRHTELVCGVITGGINYGTDKETLGQNLDILVATPGRLFEHVEKESADCRAIECLILDEADRMLDMGFAGIVNQIAAEARWRKHNMLFSATLESGGVKRFAKEILNDPVLLEADPSRKEKAKIHQWYHLADNLEHKRALLVHILKNQVTNAIVFVKTRERLQELKGFLDSQQIPACWLQGEMPQDKRNAALARFKSNEVPILLATDVAARGIDVPNVSHVINYDMPRTADIYVHRVGRTGRAGAKGTAISLVEAHDFEMVGKASRYSGETLKARVIDELRPKNKTPKVPKKKKSKKSAAKKSPKSRG
ncbi:ATP-dependent RNA helicase SrmB [Alteromonas aestuariivivens]|uniref:ATP-dependent RNA helicase SrmB n=1 Tax=Alteromonas aestuariivivens TaxID=1938339 RepID=A0A3D8M487_9ALTE|nr:ATP-dependent RNA helicase SrmB [Alteromonas aestuariivivens]RDV24428.1 ATP-dependent RNA helicase SrmB [Alteromonas aestuariivivens]